MSGENYIPKNIMRVLNKESKEILVLIIKRLYEETQIGREVIKANYPFNISDVKEIISNSFEILECPDNDNPTYVTCYAGLNAIKNHYKMTKDIRSRIELYVYFIEQQNKFIADQKFIADPYPDFLGNIFEKVLNALKKQPKNIKYEYIGRLEHQVNSTRKLEWHNFEKYNIQLNYFKKDYNLV